MINLIWLLFATKNNEMALTKQGVGGGSWAFLVSKWTSLRTGCNRDGVLWLNSRRQRLTIGQVNPYKSCVKMGSLEMDVFGFGGFEWDRFFFFFFRSLVTAGELEYWSINEIVFMKNIIWDICENN